MAKDIVWASEIEAAGVEVEVVVDDDTGDGWQVGPVVEVTVEASPYEAAR